MQQLSISSVCLRSQMSWEVETNSFSIYFLVQSHISFGTMKFFSYYFLSFILCISVSYFDVFTKFQIRTIDFILRFLMVALITLLHSEKGAVSYNLFYCFSWCKEIQPDRTYYLNFQIFEFSTIEFCVFEFHVSKIRNFRDCSTSPKCPSRKLFIYSFP